MQRNPYTIAILSVMLSGPVFAEGGSTCLKPLKNIDDVAEVLKCLEATASSDLERLVSRKNVPVGTVLAWDPILRNSDGSATGKTRVIPSGWMVCDGTNGTPNLKDKFLLGTTSFGDAGVYGGSGDHTHSVTLGRATVRENRSGTSNKDAAHYTHLHEATVSDSSNIPPFYKLLYIIKMEES